MKIAYISDTHGEIFNHPDVDVLLHAGDIYNRIGRSRGVNIKESVHLYNNISVLGPWKNAFKMPMFCVHGNHDCLDPLGFNWIDGNVIQLNEHLFVAGIGWHGECFYELPLERDLIPICQEVLRQALFKMKDGDQAILLTHYPVANSKLYTLQSNPNGWIFDCVRKVVEALRPMIVIQGHAHNLFGFSTTFDGIKYVFPGPNLLTFVI